MTVKTFSAPARRLPRTKTVVTVLVAVGFLLLGLLIVHPGRLANDSREARGSAYEDLIVAQTVCPPIVPAAKAALADGMLTIGEARALSRDLERMSSAYDEAAIMADAKRRLGLPQPKIPAACRDTADDDSGPIRLLEGN